MKHELIFVSVPYTHDDDTIELERYITSIAYVAELMNDNKFAYSPIASGVEIAKRHELPTKWEYWNDFCEAMLERSTSMHVLMMDGWEESNGVAGEIEMAKLLNIPIVYIDVNK